LTRTSTRLNEGRVIRRGLLVAAVVAVALSAASCAMEGQFGFKKFGDDAYRRIDGRTEFEANEAVDWVFLFKKNYGDHQIGIVCQKKELVWADVYSSSSMISTIKKSKPAVYGTIRNLSPGEYRLVITDVKNDNRIIGIKEFVIYEDTNEDDEGPNGPS
jgi:hypothetical protein